MKDAESTGLVDFNDPQRNMYGCLPCPKCRSEYRAASKRTGTVDCDDCGFKEPATFAEDTP